MPGLPQFFDQLPYEQPCFTFKGDRGLLGPAYVDCINNHYTTIMPGFEAAATAFGPELSPEAKERGRRMLSGQFWLDDGIDSGTVDRAAYEGILRSLPTDGEPVDNLTAFGSNLNTSIALLRNAMQPLTHDVQQQIVEDGIKIYDLTEEQMAATSMRAYIQARREEGRVAGRLTAHAFGTAARAVPERFGRWLERAVSSLSLADHASDLPEDFEHGLTQIEPTRWHAARLGMAASRDVLATLGTIKGAKATYRASVELFWSRQMNK